MSLNAPSVAARRGPRKASGAAGPPASRAEKQADEDVSVCVDDRGRCGRVAARETPALGGLAEDHAGGADERVVEVQRRDVDQDTALAGLGQHRGRQVVQATAVTVD